MASDLPGLDAVRAFGAERAAFWADPPRGACTVAECPEENPILYTRADGLLTCAGHYRQLSERGGPYPCDRCGKGPAFRDPLTREDKMLCSGCHEKEGYVPGERAMVSVVEERVGFTHSQGRREPCMAASDACRGQTKPRGKLGVLCDYHAAPKKWVQA